jgi:hypothetical protein
MNNDRLATLRLDGERVASTVEFLTSYARTCVWELDANPEVSDDDNADSPVEPQSMTSVRWSRKLEAATSFCEAGQWAMLIDPGGALDLWRQAGQLYREVNFGFGFYLSAITRDIEPQSAEASNLTVAVALLANEARRLSDKEPSYGDIVFEDESGQRHVPFIGDLGDEVEYPQQQAYWLLAAAIFVAQYNNELLSQWVADLLEYSPNRYGAAPAGALGIPVGTLWRAAGWLTQPSDSGGPMLATTLGDLARRYEESVRPAMENTYLWQNGVAPVDVGNIDIAALTLGGYLVFGERFQNALRSELERLDAVARAQLEFALDLTHPG